MDIHGVRYPQGWVSVTIRKNDLQIIESINSADEAARMCGQMFKVIDELEDLIDTSRVLPDARGRTRWGSGDNAGSEERRGQEP